jgi:hypothetical protein
MRNEGSRQFQIRPAPPASPVFPRLQTRLFYSVGGFSTDRRHFALAAGLGLGPVFGEAPGEMVPQRRLITSGFVVRAYLPAIGICYQQASLRLAMHLIDKQYLFYIESYRGGAVQ